MTSRAWRSWAASRAARTARRFVLTVHAGVGRSSTSRRQPSSWCRTVRVAMRFGRRVFCAGVRSRWGRCCERRTIDRGLENEMRGCAAMTILLVRVAVCRIDGTPARVPNTAGRKRARSVRADSILCLPEGIKLWGGIRSESQGCESWIVSTARASSADRCLLGRPVSTHWQRGARLSAQVSGLLHGWECLHGRVCMCGRARSPVGFRTVGRPAPRAPGGARVARSLQPPRQESAP